MLLLTEFITSGAKCGAREEGYSQGAPYIEQKRKFPFTLNVNSLYSAVQYSVLLKTEALVRETSARYHKVHTGYKLSHIVLTLKVDCLMLENALNLIFCLLMHTFFLKYHKPEVVGIVHL